MEFVKVIDKAELPTNKMVMVVVGGKEVLLANVDGSYFAIANKCTHAGGSLAKGVLDGHSHLSKTWCSIRCKDRQGSWGGQDCFHKNAGQR